MNDNHKTKAELIKELKNLRRQVSDQEKSETDHKRAEEILRESEEKYRSLASTKDSMYIVDREYRYRFINKTHLLRFGLSFDKVIGRSYGEFHSKEDTKKFIDRVEAVFATGNSFQTEHRSERDNKYFLRTFSPVKDLKENITEVTVISKDITERKQDEKLLLASEARLKAQYQGSPIATFTWQKKGETFKLVDYNQAANYATKGEVIKFLGKTAAEMYQSRQEILQDIHRCFTDRQIIKKELQSQNFMVGRTIIATYIFIPPDLVMVHAEDISERKLAEEALGESEQNYRNLFENAIEAIYVVQVDKLVFFNPRTVVMTGYSAEELMSRPAIEFIHPDDREVVIDRFVRRIQGEEIPQACDFRIIQKDSNIRWVELNVVVIHWKGRPATLNFMNDITERKQAEQSLRESEERFNALFNRSLDLVYIHDLEGNFLDANQATLKNLGYTREEIKFLGLRSLIDSDQVVKASQEIDELKRTGTQQNPAEFNLKCKDGRYLVVETKSSVVYHDGKPYAILGIARDITDRKRTEEALKNLSLRDDLTGLYNRRGFFALAEQGLKTAHRMGTEMVLIFGDLDNLKGINDSLGHKKGDQALADISQIFRETFRESDIIARIGGDEFVILAMNRLEDSAEKLITRFKQGLIDYNLQKKSSYTLSLSLGIAYFDPNNPCSLDVLLAQADKLMFENKPKNDILFK